ncbi:MAG TPA: DUF6036 family nucleotidyltransferase [Candidatus Eisenbacteria bacterium]|nr:DUF6036 family nucleotidyltransferase [Candidatus Eisenbacteria bacterium]
MNREQLDHVVRAVTEVVPGEDVLIIGSQAVLAQVDESDLPTEATRSIEADIAFFDDPDDSKADKVDGAIGELSKFHQTFGYYGQGVSVGTATLPAQWRDRLVRLEPTSAWSPVWCLEIHDCVVSKLVANRQKDREYAAALLAGGIVTGETLSGRVDELPDSVPTAKRELIRAWIAREAAEAS